MTDHRTSRLFVRAIVLALASILLVSGLSSPALARRDLTDVYLRIVNASREKHDLDAVRINNRLSRDAMRHTRKMIRQGRVYDPRNLLEMLEPYSWQHVGADVVGCGDTLRQIHRMFMHEAFHRSIILHEKVQRVGIGVVKVDGRSACGRDQYWLTAIFYG